MEDSNSNIIIDDQNHFYEALDEFLFYDCSETAEIDLSISQSSSSVSQLDPIEESNTDVPHKSKTLPGIPSLRRRRNFSHHVRSSDSGDVSNDSRPSYPVSLDIDYTSVPATARKFRISRNLKGNEKENENSDLYNLRFGLVRMNNRGKEETKETSTVTSANNEKTDDSIAVGRIDNEVKEEIKENSIITDANNEGTDDLNEVDSKARIVDEESSSSFLFTLAGLVIKSIGFQVNLAVGFITFPIWLLYSSYMFVMDPFGIMRRTREYLNLKLLRIWGAICGSVSPIINEWLKENNPILKLGLRFGLGLFWSVYVSFVLGSLLVFAFVISGLCMGVLVEEPIKMKEILNFDYTESSPVAFVPIMSCPAVSCSMDCREKIEPGKFGGTRVIPPNQKLQITVSLTLPESEYNRHLGIFQVRVDLLSGNGDTLSSSRHHSMLQFRSQPIRLLLTFLKIAPLLAGYFQESQTLNIHFKGLTEGDIPTTCLRVIIEQRAEFRQGAGIPEIYDASLSIESGLPLPRRILWYWKRTIFVWLSMTVFTIELLFALLCCKPLIIPVPRLRSGSTNSSSQRTSPVHR